MQEFTTQQVFALLEAHETPQKGKKSNAVDGGVGEMIGYLFQAVDSTHSNILLKSMEDKVIGYFKRSTPINAAKISAKIIDSVVNGNSKSLVPILQVLLDSDVVKGDCSHEKLAFRLRLAGGAMRSSQGAGDNPDTTILPILLPFFTVQYTQHSE